MKRITLKFEIEYSEIAHPQTEIDTPSFIRKRLTGQPPNEIEQNRYQSYEVLLTYENSKAKVRQFIREYTKHLHGRVSPPLVR